MKKTVKNSLLVVIMAVILFALTGCGQTKVVATKSTSSEENLLGVSYEETIEITFKKDKTDKITWTIECDDEQSAKKMASLYTLAATEHEDLEIKQDGKKIIMTMGTAFFSSEADLDEDEMTKDNIIKVLEEKGYTVK